MKKLLLTIPLFLILPLSAFAAVSYSRTPSGINILSPVSVSVSFDDYSETGCSSYPAPDSWYIGIETDGDFSVNSGYISSTTKSYIFSTPLPVGNYYDVAVYCHDLVNGDTGGSPQLFLEETGETIFTIISPPSGGGGVLFGHSGESNAIVSGGGGSALAAVGLVSTNAISGIFPYLMLSAGVFLTFYIIQQLVMFLGREKIKKDKK